MTGAAKAAAVRTQHRPAVQRLARVSIGARAVVYLLLAYLTARLALASPAGHSDSTQGAFVSVVREPGGQEAVALLGLGFLVYAAWRLLQAIGGDDSVDGGTELFKRAGWACIAVAYLLLAGEAAETSIVGHGGAQNATSGAAHVLALPGGRVLLFVAGLGVVCGAVGLMVWAALQRFEVYLPDRRLPGWAEPVVHLVGTTGNLARGAAFAAVGATFAAAAVVGRASDAKGLGSALASLTRAPAGRPLLGLVALGFLAFSAMSLLEARYREL